MTIVFNKGENFHATKTSTGYEITYKNDGEFYSRTVSLQGDVNSPKIISYADERIPLLDGAKLIRTEGNLTVIKE